MKMILGIFVLKDDNVECILWDINDATEFYFLSSVGNIIHYTQYYGMYEYNGFDYYKFNTECNMEFAYGLYLYNIYNFSEVDSPPWYEKHPDIISEGVYYIKSTVKFTDEEMLEEKQFMKEFEEIIGLPLDCFLPNWFFEVS